MFNYSHLRTYADICFFNCVISLYFIVWSTSKILAFITTRRWDVGERISWQRNSMYLSNLFSVVVIDVASWFHQDSNLRPVILLLCCFTVFCLPNHYCLVIVKGVHYVCMSFFFFLMLYPNNENKILDIHNFFSVIYTIFYIVSTDIVAYTIKYFLLQASYLFEIFVIWKMSYNSSTSTISFFSREILALGFDEKFIRTWEYYFIYCAAGFKSLTLGNYQVMYLILWTWEQMRQIKCKFLFSFVVALAY